ncbi:hypothetical protein VTJ83DRAFT_1097 [Remersonia thermophila]|uniref:GH16 domain-containing protein n=1 Tax=Remersonia thermophila TaxID=72144 RepID=A0ABR4DN06_9PEZI
MAPRSAASSRPRRSRMLPCLRAAVPSALLLLAAAGPLSARAETVLADDDDNNDACECYVINDDQGTYFTHHRFFDFGNLSEHAGVPPALRDAAASARANVTSAYFLSDAWARFWMINSWNSSAAARADATVAMVNSPNNVYIEAGAEPDPPARTWLTLRTQRLPGFQTVAEIESLSARFKYLSVRMHARTVGAPGAITALFTYRHADALADVQEADLEIRTSDPRNLLRYTNQPSYTEDGAVVPGASVNATMPGGRDWTAWATHRLDWVPGRAAWRVDGAPTAALAFQAPRDESALLLNAWSDGGAWTGNMSLFDAAYLQVQWIEVVFNSTARRNGPGGPELSRARKRKRRDGDEDEDEDDDKDDDESDEDDNNDEKKRGGCKVVCSIDETPVLGRPVVLWRSGAKSWLRGGGGGGGGWGVPAVVMAVMALAATGWAG